MNVSLFQGCRKSGSDGPTPDLQENWSPAWQENGGDLQERESAQPDSQRGVAGRGGVRISVQVQTVELHIVEEEHEEGPTKRQEGHQQDLC